MENVNNAYASQDEVKEKSGNLCTLFEKDGNLLPIFQFCSVRGGAEQIFVLQATVVFVLRFSFLSLLPGFFKSRSSLGRGEVMDDANHNSSSILNV